MIQNACRIWVCKNLLENSHLKDRKGDGTLILGYLTGKHVVRVGVDGIDSGSCPPVAFGISCVNPKRPLLLA